MLIRLKTFASVRRENTCTLSRVALPSVTLSNLLSLRSYGYGNLNFSKNLALKTFLTLAALNNSVKAEKLKSSRAEI